MSQTTQDAATSETNDRSGVCSVTIVIPCYNEEETLPALFTRLDALAADKTSSCDYRFLFIDDGSSDATRENVRTYASTRSNADYIFLSRNFGKEQAMLAGIDAVETDTMVIIDADLQDPPELIPQMVELWRQGYDDVYARRRSRQGEGWFKRATSHLYYRVLQSMSSVQIQPDTGDFRLLDRRCVLALRQLREQNRNTKALFSWIGFKKIEFLYDRAPREAGKSKWNYPKLVGLAIDGMTSFSTAPLRIATVVGSIVSLVAACYAIYLIVRTLAWGVDVPGYASLMVVILFLGGVQLLTIGIIGEYLGRVFTEVKQRPTYLVQEEHLGGENAAETAAPASQLTKPVKQVKE